MQTWIGLSNDVADLKIWNKTFFLMFYFYFSLYKSLLFLYKPLLYLKGMTAKEHVQVSLFFKICCEWSVISVNQKAPRSHWVEYIIHITLFTSHYFTESPIFVPIRWNKHINLKNFKAPSAVFVMTWKLLFVPKHYKKNQSHSMIFIGRSKRHNKAICVYIYCIWMQFVC